MDQELEDERLPTDTVRGTDHEIRGGSVDDVLGNLGYERIIDRRGLP